ncbi:MAG: ABC transporter permease [Candidatus Hodarchaeota archaeon]
MKALINLIICYSKIILRDRQSLLWMTMIPVGFMLLLGATMQNSLMNMDKGFKIGIVDQRQSDYSKSFIKVLKDEDMFKISELDEKFNLEECLKTYVLIIKLKSEFSDTSNAMALYYNETAIPLHEIAIQVLEKNIAKFQLKSNHEQFKSNIEKFPQSTDEKFRYIDLLLPGMIAMIILQTGVFLIGVNLTNAREIGALRQYNVTPLKKWIFILAFMIPKVLLIIAQIILVTLVAHFVNGVQITGNIYLMILTILIGIITFFSIGVIIASLSKTPNGATSIGNFVHMTMILLCGVFFPTDFMPNFARQISRILPLTYLIDALRDIIIKNYNFTVVLPNLMTLSGFLFICAIISIKTFRWD